MTTKKTKEQTKTQTVTTPTNPSWVTNSVQGFQGRIDGLNNVDPLSYVAPASALQQQAFDRASNLGGPSFLAQTHQFGAPKGGYSDGRQVNGGPGDGYTPPPQGSGYMPTNFDLASVLAFGGGMGGPNLTGPAAQASAEGFTREGLQSRLSPYLQEVVDASLADFDFGAGQARARQVAAAAASGGARNSNNALRAGELDAGLQRGRATTAATLRDQGFTRAADILGRDNDRSAQASAANAAMANQVMMFNASQQDNSLARQLQAAGVLSSIGSAQGADERANVGLLGDLGAQQREIDRQTRAAPLDLLGLQSGLYAAQPYGLFKGQSSNTDSLTRSSSTEVDLARAAMAGASLFSGNPLTAVSSIYGGGGVTGGTGLSDERVKTNIKPIGPGPSGDQLYEFSYADDPTGERFVGPMAQEVAMTNPDVVGVEPSGLLSLDYNALGLPSPSQQSAGAMPGGPMAAPIQAILGGGPNAGDPRRQQSRPVPRRGLFGKAA